MENFTPISSMLGGALIGLAATILMVVNGRIAGVSGVISGIGFASRGDRDWRIFFVLGMIAAPMLYLLVSGNMPAFELEASWPLIVVGGLLVGFGTRLGSGCTSGHGVCGMSRLAPRSIVSVALFMSVGVITVAIAKSLNGA
ncbi:MAG: YeeE/YedE family protein [Henriciella sp.]|nr:YeeE/YedE family protein [Henriciella sp.]